MSQIERFHLSREWVEFDIVKKSGETVTCTDAKIAVLTRAAGAAGDPAVGDYVTATITGSGTPTLTVSRLHGPVPAGPYVVYVKAVIDAEDPVRRFPMVVT